MNERSCIQTVGITRVFGRGSGAVTVLKGVDMTIPMGQMTAFIGRSGSGKTTLINLLGALDQPTEGSIQIDNQMITEMTDKEREQLRRSQIGLVFQSFALIPLMTAYENVEFVLRIAGYSAKERKKAALEALEQVGLTSRMHHRPFEMSGGEQQRIAIARAIAHKPKLILADEPTAELDSITGIKIMKVFRDLINEYGLSVILTSHDPEIIEIVDQVYELEDGLIVSRT
ncbi:putative ABC transporter ATP-binding protein [compost metagenome]